MQNLQKLFDFYRDTHPSKGKLNAAANLLIHVCTALKVKTPEQVYDYLIEDIPVAIDDHFQANHDRAIQDKSILAEMIGRFGPKEGWEVPFKALLGDSDSNLRQFALQSLEYCGQREPALILPYIEKYSQSRDLLLRNIAAILVGRIFCSGNLEFLAPVIQKWKEEDNTIFIQEIMSNINSMSKSSPEKGQSENCKQFQVWLYEKFDIQPLAPSD